MSADLIAAIGALDATGSAFLTPAPQAAPAGGFGAMVAEGLEQMNSHLVSAEHDIKQLASGNAPNLHEIMMHMEEAKLSMQLLAQVRNRLLDAYQEVMRMQV